SYFTPSAPTPALVLADAPAKVKLDTAAAKVAALETELTKVKSQQQEAFSSWVKSAPKAGEMPNELARFSFDILEGGKSPNEVTKDQPAVVKGANTLEDGRSGKAIKFTGDDALDLGLGNFKRHEPFSISLWMKTPDKKDRAVVFHRSQASTDAASRGYEMLIEDRRLKWSLIHFWPGNAISIRDQATVPLNEWVHVVVSSDGSSKAEGLRIFVNGKPAVVDVVRDGLTKEITGGGHENISIGERFRDRGFKDGLIDDFRVFGRELSALEAGWLVQGTASAESTAQDSEAWREYFPNTGNEDVKKTRAALAEARAAWYALQDAGKEIMVMKELPQPKKAFVLFRGEYTQPREEVSANTPEALPPFPKDLPRNRLGLAQWLTNRQNPLFARVTVNRLWLNLYGRGLVKTAEDFGSQGERPLYPELLDWLAGRFMDSGWDVKALLKTIVLSKTYRQQSIGSLEMMTEDPDNQWLARGPRFRLPAEMIRDNALAASGLLSPQLGGPPVNPYEMEEAFKPAKPSGGQGVYRRSLYTNWRRTSPPPALLAFDAPRRAVCSAKRERTDSPLQALILLNGTQFVEAARVLGEKLHREHAGNLEGMIEAGFLTCLSRRPDERERSIARQLYTEQLEVFRKQPKEAWALLGNGNAPRDIDIPAPEAAAATVLAQVLLNHDVCVVKR
ncbi:MAG TPA: DUF1553 domain-containing protein, partial [Verrucomicrobium sp.]|nr:DUF1553 domain-containing protein [Verrucomicrobium sp.]